MTRFSVKFNVPLAQQAERAAQVASKVVFTEMNGRFQDAIGSPVWAWPRGKNPRTIVDTGALRQSNVFAVEGYDAVFRWTVNYASFVHEGAHIFPWGNTDATRVYCPPRPWTDAVLGTATIGGIQPYGYRQRFKEAWVKAMKL